MEKYAIVYNTTDINDYRNETTKGDYYFFGYDELSKIKILSSDEFYYGLKENKDSDLNVFELITDSSANKSHGINFRYFDKNSSSNDKESLLKTYNYGYFKNGNDVVRIFEGDRIQEMKVENIDVVYICTQNYPDELIRVRCVFSGETILTGKLTSYFDEGYGINMVFFVADDAGMKKLPIHNDDIRGQGGITFDYEVVKELIGTEPFEKKCEITIKNYNIHKAYKDTVDTADLIEVNFLE